VDIVFDTAAKLDNLDDGDLLFVKVSQSASSGTHGVANLVGADIFCS
jgi:SOS-response transcriptional repressor LexA